MSMGEGYPWTLSLEQRYPSLGGTCVWALCAWESLAVPLAGNHVIRLRVGGTADNRHPGFGRLCVEPVPPRPLLNFIRPAFRCEVWSTLHLDYPAGLNVSGFGPQGQQMHRTAANCSLISIHSHTGNTPLASDFISCSRK